MNIDKLTLARMRELCAEIDSEDGLSPSQLRRRRRRALRAGEHDRKTLQLCGAAARALNLALAAAEDPALQQAVARSVAPAPDASRLLVTLDPGGGDPDALRAAADGARGWLRAEVAQAINRKKAPELRFVVAGGGA